MYSGVVTYLLHARGKLRLFHVHLHGTAPPALCIMRSVPELRY